MNVELEPDEGKYVSRNLGNTFSMEDHSAESASANDKSIDEKRTETQANNSRLKETSKTESESVPGTVVKLLSTKEELSFARRNQEET